MQANPGRKRERVLLGYVAGAYGVKGWTRIQSDTEPKEAIFDYQPWLMGDDGMPVRVLLGRKQGKHLVAELEGILDRDMAESLAWQKIAVYRDQLPDLKGLQYYWADLIGLDVQLLDGRNLGKVDSMMATGANDVLVVKGDRERLIPFIRDQVVREVDLDKGLIQVDWDPDF